MALSQPATFHTVHSTDYIARGPQSYEGLHALVPVILGLAAPFLLTLIIAAGFVGGPIALPIFGLLPLLALAAVAFLVSLVSPGRITAASFDPGSEVATFVHLGTFANTVRRVPFNQIAAVRMAVSYDQMGTKQLQPVVELVSGRRLDLPSDTSWNDIEIVRRMLVSEIDPNEVAWARKRETMAVRQRPTAGRRG